MMLSVPKIRITASTGDAIDTFKFRYILENSIDYFRLRLTPMTDNDTELLDRSLKALEDCGDTLGRISASCCMPERSSQMTGAFGELRKAVSELQHGQKNQDTLSECIENIAQCGGQIGKLYVTCCTETREPLYQHILKQLNEAHENLRRIVQI